MRQVQRKWVLSRAHARVLVSTVHPQFGPMPRGVIRTVGIEDGHIRWQMTDFDHNDLGVIVGNYVDAERTLLDATAALDELAPPEQVSGVEELASTAIPGGTDE